MTIIRLQASGLLSGSSLRGNCELPHPLLDARLVGRHPRFRAGILGTTKMGRGRHRRGHPASMVPPIGTGWPSVGEPVPKCLQSEAVAMRQTPFGSDRSTTGMDMTGGLRHKTIRQDLKVAGAPG